MCVHTDSEWLPVTAQHLAAVSQNVSVGLLASMQCARRSVTTEMEAALAKASLRMQITLGVVIGEKHGALAMEHAAAVFAELWDEEDRVQKEEKNIEK